MFTRLNPPLHLHFHIQSYAFPWHFSHASTTNTCRPFPDIMGQKCSQNLEQHSMERLPLPSWTVYVLYSTNRWIWIRAWTKIESACSCHLPNSSIKFRPNPSNFLRYRAIYHFWTNLSMVKKHVKKILVSGCGSSPKSNPFVLVTHPTCPPSFSQIHP